MIYARYAVWAALAGMFIPVMAVLNGRLGRSLGEPLHAPVVLFAVALMFACAVSFGLTGRLPTTIMATAPVNLLGGIIVGFYVVSITLLAPRFGVGNAILFVMVAQVVSSAAIDHFGIFGATVRALDTRRIVGLAVLVVGLAITQSTSGQDPRSSPSASAGAPS